MKVELTKGQVEILATLADRAQILGRDAEMLVELKNVLKRALQNEATSKTNPEVEVV
ncbi:hypothetical protein M0R04_12855 [Candidatus Dojkabacteria bacterium]|jgi:hypothetical protein|nr:hypothetical protein [Candidatus Dojkabacteria bacterium]